MTFTAGHPWERRGRVFGIARENYRMLIGYCALLSEEGYWEQAGSILNKSIYEVFDLYLQSVLIRMAACGKSFNEAERQFIVALPESKQYEIPMTGEIPEEVLKQAERFLKSPPIILQLCGLRDREHRSDLTGSYFDALLNILVAMSWMNESREQYIVRFVKDFYQSVEAFLFVEDREKRLNQRYLFRKISGDPERPETAGRVLAEKGTGSPGAMKPDKPEVREDREESGDWETAGPAFEYDGPEAEAPEAEGPETAGSESNTKETESGDSEEPGLTSAGDPEEEPQTETPQRPEDGKTEDGAQDSEETGTETTGTEKSGTKEPEGWGRRKPERTGADDAGRNSELDRLLEELQELVGLKEVKAEIQSLINLIKIRRLRSEHGLPSMEMSYHMVFTGSPGTGKTTVARLVAKIYKELGLLTKGNLIETDRSGLVAGYVGQTALKVKEVVERAIGGVLFIDEAYSLSGSGAAGNDFGGEAIDTLVKLMEDHREDLVVIVAGYTEEMKEFLASNTGLVSRFNKFIEFPDYSEEELIRILNSMADRMAMQLSEEGGALLRDWMAGFGPMEKKRFGNARGIRNLFEKAVVYQANRLVTVEEPTLSDLSEITKEDLEHAAGLRTPESGENEPVGKL